MMKRAGILAVFSTLVFACAGSEPDDGAGSSASAATTGSSLAAVFAGVAESGKTCFERNYGNAHLASHPKQTVTNIRVELTHGDEKTDAFAPANGARVTFTEKTGSGPKIRLMSCELTNGKVLCTEESSCTSSFELAMRDPGILRLTNRDLRASGECDVTPKALDASVGANDVFDLAPIECWDTSTPLANPPTVDCQAAIRDVRTCIEVIPLDRINGECHSKIKKGERWADEFSDGMAEGQRLESTSECIQRFTDVAEVDGCCGG